MLYIIPVCNSNFEHNTASVRYVMVSDRIKDGMARNQDNVFEWGIMSVRGRCYSDQTI